LIVIFAKPVGQHPDWDCCLAAQNLMLAAQGFGLATCPIGLAWPLFEQDDIKQESHVPNPYKVVLPIIVGYATHPVEKVARSAPKIFSWR
jgi:nitroreductase